MLSNNRLSNIRLFSPSSSLIFDILIFDEKMCQILGFFLSNIRLSNIRLSNNGISPLKHSSCIYILYVGIDRANDSR